MANKRKVTTAIVAGVTAVALLLGGTFAWQSISQTALNEASDVINPGGRLHDDFNGSNKDVYVENFADEEIFARIRLDEYFEIIMNKGVTGAERIESIAGTKDADGNISSWATHKFDGNDLTAPYWEWLTGGSTVYMPTFNKNKDSLVADINGTYQGKDGIVTDKVTDDRYTDYKEYAVGDPKTDTEIYDGDTNMDDEVKNDFKNPANYVTAGNIVTVDNVTHTAKETLGATLISMDQWIAEGSVPGEYWVYDTDGWVYWAQAIKPDTATGLLLDGIALKGVMDDSWYYAINVVAQFVTADDVGKTDSTGFYDTENGTAPSDNALALLEKIGVTVSADDNDEDGDSSDETFESYSLEANATSITYEEYGFLVTGDTVDFALYGHRADGTKKEITEDVTWSANAVESASFTPEIDNNGYLTLGSRTDSIYTNAGTDTLTVSAEFAGLTTTKQIQFTTAGAYLAVNNFSSSDTYYVGQEYSIEWSVVANFDFDGVLEEVKEIDLTTEFKDNYEYEMSEIVYIGISPGIEPTDKITIVSDEFGKLTFKAEAAGEYDITIIASDGDCTLKRDLTFTVIQQ